MDNKPSSVFYNTLINLVLIHHTIFKLFQYIINDPVVTAQATSYMYFTNCNNINALANMIEL